jgi:hypothetical protein
LAKKRGKFALSLGGKTALRSDVKLQAVTGSDGQGRLSYSQIVLSIKKAALSGLAQDGSFKKAVKNTLAILLNPRCSEARNAVALNRPLP